MNSFDIVIAGTGAAGLSLAMRLINEPALAGKRILLADREKKLHNDRTWCFWEDTPGFFEHLVHTSWDKAWFHGQEQSMHLQLHPFRYKLVRASDFYSHCLAKLQSCPNVEWITGEIRNIIPDDNGVSCEINEERVKCDYLFSSIYEKPALDRKDHYLLQHFRGWKIRMEKPVFDPSTAVLMDFRVAQDQGTTFCYVLPFSETEALVEFTLFSETPLDKNSYETGLRNYLERNYPSTGYRILEEEQGIIPMTDHRFPAHDRNVVFIGTAGGWTKASTGYTFNFIQKHCDRIVQNLVAGIHPCNELTITPRRFLFYDRTLLEILQKKKVPGHIIFEKLFIKNDVRKIFRFLDNETRLSEEVGLLFSLPVWPFLKAAVRSF